MLTKALRFAVFLILATAAATVFGQAETAFKLADDPGGKVLFAKTDIENNIYTAVQDSKGIYLRIYDPFGALIRSYGPLQDATSVEDLMVAPVTGTAIVFANGYFNVYEWDGLSEYVGINPIIGHGIDPTGNLLVAMPDGGNTTIEIYSPDSALQTWTVPVTASSALFDDYGDVALLDHTGTFEKGTNTLNVYSELGKPIFSASYPTSGTQRTSVAGFLSESFEEDFIILDNYNSGLGDFTSVQIVGNSNLLTNSVAGDPAAFCTDNGIIYIENGSSLSAINGEKYGANSGMVRWTKPRVASALAPSGSGPVALQYNTANSTVELWKHNYDTGTLENSLSLGVATAEQVGGLIGTNTRNILYYGANSAGALLADMAFGTALSSISMPASVIGGNNISALISFDGVAANLYFQVVSSNPTALTPPNVIEANGQTVTTTWPTSAVDADTVVKIFASQGYPFIQKTATVKVTTATLANFSAVLSTLNPPQATTVNATLSGAAGPSGKTIALSSNNSAITLPASLHINAGVTSGSATITSHPVAVDTTVTLKATLGALSQTALVVVKTPVITGLKLSSSSIVGGNSATGTATFSAQPAAGQTMLVGSSLPVVATAAPSDSVNSTSVAFPITTHGDSANATSVISVTFGSITFHQNLIVGPAALASAVLSQAQVKGGTSVTFTLTLNGQAPSTGGTAQFGTSNSALATGPASIKFADDGTSAVVTITTKPVTTQQTVTLSATYLGVTKSQVLTLTP